FSGLAGRDLSGAIALVANGTLSPLIGGFDLTLEGSATGLGVDDPIADGLLAGTVDLSGRVARAETGLIAEDFRIGNDQLVLTADGTYATGAADFAFDLALSDLGLLSPQASGRLAVSGTASGSEGTLALAADADIAQGTL